MDVIYWLIPLSIVIIIIAVAILFWAVRSGQFQDLDSAALDILMEDDDAKIPSPKNKNTFSEKQKS